jgi:hypothetical protein
VEREQRGAHRAEYGAAVLEHLAEHLTARCGRGFSRRNLDDMRRFYLTWPIRRTLSAKSIRQTASAKSVPPTLPLPWSHYVRLLSVQNHLARSFYEAEALRGGWTIRQLTRQIESQFYERTALSKNKVAMLSKGARRRASDAVTAEEELKDPLVLEFLGALDAPRRKPARRPHPVRRERRGGRSLRARGSAEQGSRG